MEAEWLKLLRRQEELSAFVALAEGCVGLIFYKVDFAYYDDQMLTDFSVQGKNSLPPVPSVGRYKNGIL